VEIISQLPENDNVEIDRESLDTILNFLVELGGKLMPNESVTEEDELQFHKICDILEKREVYKMLLSAFRRYRNANNTYRLSVCVVLGYFNLNRKIPPDMIAILTPLKEAILSYLSSGTFSGTFIWRIIDCLTSLAFNENNCVHLLDAGYASVLLQMVTVTDLVLVQYSIIALDNLTAALPCDVAGKLVSAGAWVSLSRIFERLTLVTSTVPAPYLSLKCALRVIHQVVKADPSSGESLMKTSVIGVTCKILLEACSLVVGSGLSGQMEVRWIMSKICGIYSCCGNSVANVEALFGYGVLSAVLTALEMLANERKKKERKDVEKIIKEIILLIYNWSFKGVTSHERNKMYQIFESSDSIKKLTNIFMVLKSVIPRTDDLRKCLGDITLSICWLFRGEVPIVMCGVVLEYGYELMNAPSLSSGFDYPKEMRIAWKKMRNPDKTLNEWKEENKNI
jgi:hypothetical protein